MSFTLHLWWPKDLLQSQEVQFKDHLCCLGEVFEQYLCTVEATLIGFLFI